MTYSGGSDRGRRAPPRARSRNDSGCPRVPRGNQVHRSRERRSSTPCRRDPPRQKRGFEHGPGKKRETLRGPLGDRSRVEDADPPDCVADEDGTNRVPEVIADET